MKRLSIILILLALCWPTAVFAAVGIGNRAQGTATVTSPHTTSFTTTAASPLLACIVWQGTATISGVTFNGSPMTQIAQEDDSAGLAKTALYGMLSPAVTTANVVTTWDVNPDAAQTFIIGTTGGDTTTGWRTATARNDADGGGPGLTVADSQSGDIVFHCAAVFQGTITFDVGEDVTSTEDDAIAGGGTSGGLSTKTASGASTVVGATDDPNYSEIAVAVMANAGGGGPAASIKLMIMGVGP